MRAGIGFDVHPLVEGRPLMLGGVAVPFGKGLSGHSDGDVLVHAIIDALLGAAGLGDIGAMFPSSDERWSGANSLDLLHLAGEAVREAGHRAANLDATVIAQAPVLAPHVKAMRGAIASELGMDISSVSVKATTTDGLGVIGEGGGIAALALVLLE